MHSDSIGSLYKFLNEYAVGAGALLMQYRDKVQDIGKAREELRGSEQEEGGLALSVVDQIIQEGFLWELHRQGLAGKIEINCEEDTPLKHLFRTTASGLWTVHQDPCDGTKPYLEGKNDFASGYGISDPDHRFTHTVICAPARDRVYTASPEDGAWVYDTKGNITNESLGTRQNRVFSKRALNEKGKEEARKAGLIVEGIESAHCRIIDVALGDAGAYLYGKANPHDSFVPYAFARAMGVSLTDVKNNPLDGSHIVVRTNNGLPVFERVPSVVYIANDNPYEDTIREILSNPDNLEAEMKG